MRESAEASRSLQVSVLTCTPNQRRAITHTAGPAQILAGPGSGKTFVTVQRIRHLILEEGTEPSHILVITFTKAAALEMQQRFFTLMEGEKPPVWFGTFHAIFYHILKQSVQYRNYTIMTEVERRKLVRQVIHMNKKFRYLQEEDIEEILLAISSYKAGCGEHAVQIQKMAPEDFTYLLEEYQSYLREFLQFDFDDLMLLCLEMLREDSACLKRWQAQFRYILVDEFQDISPVQYEIVRLLAAPENNLFIVGDDDQSIYGFRGASPESMMRFLTDYRAAEQILLDVNYRCHEDIVNAAGRVIAENRNRLEKNILAAHREGEGIALYTCANEEELRKNLLESLLQEQRNGRLTRCAMICRTNFACGLWAQVLHGAGIPYVMREKRKNRFTHFVIQDIRAYLALGQGELQRKHFLRIMNRPVRYLRRDSMPKEQVDREELLLWYQSVPAVQEKLKRLFQDLDYLSSRKLHLQIHYIRKVIGYENYLRDKYDAERAEELVKIAEEFEAFSRQFMSGEEMDHYIEHYTEVLQEPVEKKEGITLMTMHASKGLEFDTVYLPDCNEGQIPSDKSLTEEGIEEERRMFYVAMTRARQNLYLFTHKGRTGKDGPSRFLKSIGQ
ncbi:MAG: ATP-dependent helicase [Lachnospiraceae bacterium]|nr:ATP-dependent helicase [Lachnospiraceae bacterium]